MIEWVIQYTKQISKQNQDLVNEINKLKEENGSLKEKVDTLKTNNEYLIGKMKRARTELCFNKKGRIKMVLIEGIIIGMGIAFVAYCFTSAFEDQEKSND